MLVHDSTNYYIGCTVDHAPDDRWLSLAETFELLSEEEEPGGPFPRVADQLGAMSGGRCLVVATMAGAHPLRRSHAAGPSGP